MSYLKNQQDSNSFSSLEFTENNNQNQSLDNLVKIASNMSNNFNYSLINQDTRNSGESSETIHSNITTPSNLDMKSKTPPIIDQSNNKPMKSKKMACVECRQQKSRCDAYEKQPAPCTRCFKKGLKCDLKSDYKRTYKRARIAQIEKEFSELKKSLHDQQAAELLAKFPSLSNSSTINDIPTNSGLKDLNEYKRFSAENHKNNNSSQFNKNNFIDFGPNFQQEKNAQSNYLHNSHKISNLNDSNATSNKHSQESFSNKGLKNFTEQKDLDQLLWCEEKTLDTITLSSETIGSLYLEYVENYHIILPVVDISKGPERIYKLCPALFWVIMFVSLRRFKQASSDHLLIQLSPMVKSILAEIMISPITRYNPTEEDEPIFNVSSVYSVQAFLLYSYWPPITSSLSADSSYNTVGTAFFQAIRIGLHSPLSNNTVKNFSQNQKDNNQLQNKTPQQLSMITEQIKTWVVCNIASQNIATAFGFPACVQFESSIWSYNRADSEIKIPQVLQVMMEIAHFEDQMSKSLNSNPLDPSGLIDANERLPLLKLLSKRLDELEIKLDSQLSEHDKRFRKFEIFSTRIHLLSYYFMDSTKISQFELQNGLIKLFNASIILVDHTQTCQLNDKKFIKYLPGVHLLNLWQAACIIGKLIHSDLKNFINVQLGKQNYEYVINLTAKASILKHDMAFRSSGITKNMWQLFVTLDKMKMNNLSIDIRNRMSASVFFDCLNLLRTQVGMTKLNIKTDDNNPVDDDFDEGEIDENVISSEDEIKENKSNVGNDDENTSSRKSTPASTTSSGKTRKTRTLSNTIDAESKARRIIRTIPLDPEPISINNKRSSIFKVVNSSNDSSPHFKSDSASPTNMKVDQNLAPKDKFSDDDLITQRNQNFTLQQQKPQHSYTYPQFAYKQSVPSSVNFQQNQNLNSTNQISQFANLQFNESPGQMALENLEMSQFDHEMLWKDVDSVMNDFGFHI